MRTRPSPRSRNPTDAAVVRADEQTRRPGPTDLAPLSCNEIQRLFITLIVRLVHGSFGWSTAQPTGSAGPTGDVAIKLAPAAAMTGDKPQT